MAGLGKPQKPVADISVPITRPVVIPESDLSKPDTVESDPPIVASDKVMVTLGSLPAGAVMEVQGMGQVCSSAPCDVEVDAGRPIVVTARIGSVSKEMTVTPSGQNRDVLIELDIPKTGTGTGKPRKGSRGGGVDRTSGDRATDNTGGNGLKIPDLFKNN
jgi:hypothetical protein